LSFPVPISSGTYRLRVAVADANGNVGSVQEQLTPGLTSMGSIPTSDLFLFWSDGKAPPHLMASETLPVEASRLRVSLELYPAEPMAGGPLRVEFAVMPVGATSPVMTRDAQVTAEGSARLATVDIPIDTLATGRYSVQATVYQGGATIGQISASVRKQGSHEPHRPRVSATVTP
jgi:hypothetical protein